MRPSLLRSTLAAATLFPRRCIALASSASSTTSRTMSSSSFTFTSSVTLPSSLTTIDSKRSGIHDCITDTIGNTPIVKLSKMSPKEGVDIYVKLESENPGGSVKDRLALGVMEWAQQTGQLKPGQTVVEATSGNTGIGLAMVCAQKGHPFVCVMAESFSIERRKLMRFLGARVILTSAAHKGSGMVIKAQELADEHGWFFPNQFENEANAWIHEQTTGPEIVHAMKEAGIQLDYFCVPYGSGGTLKGVGKVLREKSPETKIYVCEPDNAPMLYSNIETEYPADGKPSTSFAAAHPVWRPHLLQGWATDFIPKLVSSAKDEEYIDEVVHPGGYDAIQTAHELAMKEGIFSGTSGGGVLSSALKIAETAPEGTSILAMIPDTGERYLSTPLFDDIPADMTEEEKKLAESTPSTPPPAPDLPGVLPEATEFVQKTNSENKVVVWSLIYCEFCWTLSKVGLMSVCRLSCCTFSCSFSLSNTLSQLLDALEVPYEIINIDSFEYAKDQMGNKYRAALCEMTDCPTFPQLFIDGKFIGGAADACIMWKNNELQEKFTEAGIQYADYQGDPFEFLPKWMSQNPLRDK